MKLSQGSAQQKEDLSSEAKRESRCASAAAASSGAGAADKLKASNFPASLLRIGSWEVYSRCFVLLLL